MDDARDAAIEALEDLGLSTYEAKVFIALTQLGSGTAREIHEVGDVPRSQVYGTVEQLEKRGLVEVMHADPLLFRPVDLEEAESILAERIDRARGTAFDFLESARKQADTGSEEPEEVWSIQGRDPIGERIDLMAQNAEESILFGCNGRKYLTDAVIEQLHAAANDGLVVQVVSHDPAVLEVFAESTAIRQYGIPPAFAIDRAARMAVVDRAVVLLSVEETGGPIDADREVAIWSRSDGFAGVLAAILESWFETVVAPD